MLSPATVRRSQRARKLVETICNQAEREISKRSLGSSSSASSPKRRRRSSSPRKSPVTRSSSSSIRKSPRKKLATRDKNDDEEESEKEGESDKEVEENDEEEQDDEPMMSTSSSEEDSDDDESFDEKKNDRKSKPPVKSSTPRKNTPRKNTQKTNLRKIAQNRDPDEDDNNDSDEGSREGRKERQAVTGKRTALGRRNRNNKELGPATSNRQLHTAFKAMTKRILSSNGEGEETPESSLTAALLYYGSGVDKNKDIAGIARHFVEQHVTNDVNRAHVDLLNLIFRSVGSRYEHLLQHDDDLGNLSEDELAEVIQQVYDDMSATSADAILLCSDPHGAFGGKIGGNLKQKIVVQEYRNMYRNFWYELGLAIVGVSDISEGKTQDDNSRIDIVRDIILRLMELVWVGVPDIRAAVSIAIYQLAQALLHRTAQWKSKLQVADRQYQSAKRISGASGSSSTRKSNALQQQVQALKDSIEGLEGIVKTSVMEVFVRRYRDKNEHIRVESLRAMSAFTLIRPDIFLNGTYLKYFGWLLSDKVSCVRQAAISGLLAPFREQQQRDDKNKNSNSITTGASNNIEMDLTGMTSVIQKFLKRLAECAMDVDIGVQEVAMELLLFLVRNDFFDDIEDDEIWQQINLRAIAPNTSPSVRRNALYFVMEQLHQFDTGSSESENDAVERIKALVEWLSHVLSEKEIPIEHIRYELTDLLVASLRSMPEHNALVCNWMAILQTLQGDSTNKRIGRKSIGKGNQRNDAVQQRTCLRYLVASAELEVQSLTDASDSNITVLDIDKDLLEIQNREKETVQLPKKKEKKRTSTSQEELTLALLRALPGLMVAFKSETSVLQNLTTLPRYLLPSVFNLPSRKKDFHSLVSTLSSLFIEGTDETVLNNCSLALVSLTRGDHARKDEALLVLKKMTNSLSARLSELLEEKGKQLPFKSEHDNSEEIDDDSDDSILDTEYSLSLCLRRLRIISKRWYLPDLLTESSDESEKDHVLENIFKSVTEHFSKELTARQLALSQENIEDGEVPKIWTSVNDNVHSVIAASISEALDLLLSLTAWKLTRAIASIDDYDEEEIGDHILLRMRNQMIKLVLLCYEQYVEPEYSDKISDSQLEFSLLVQQHAGRLTGDLRMLFPKGWVSAKSKLLASLALTQEVPLVGGLVRFVRSQEEKLREGYEGQDNSEAIHRLLLPLARGLAGNWLQGNRKEAGLVLGHIAGSGKAATNLVHSLARVCKKIHSVRLLEAYMAYLRQDFNDWKVSQPEELESDRPTDEELAEFENAEKLHTEMFEGIETRAVKLSSFLGVGSIKDKTLAPALVGFIREGIRVAFSTEIEGSDESMLPGDRLTFLLPLSKFLPWIRRNKNAYELLKNDINKRESDLRNHPDYDDIYAKDKEAIELFRKAGDLGPFIGVADDEATTGKSTVATNNADSTAMGGRSLAESTTAGGRSIAESTTAGGRSSTVEASAVGVSSTARYGSRFSQGDGGSSVSSASLRSSKYSSSRSLSPVEEEDQENEGNAKQDEEAIDGGQEDNIDDDISQLSPSPRKTKRRKLSGSSKSSRPFSLSTVDQSSIAEASDESDD